MLCWFDKYAAYVNDEGIIVRLHEAPDYIRIVERKDVQISDIIRLLSLPYGDMKIVLEKVVKDNAIAAMVRFVSSVC